MATEEQDTDALTQLKQLRADNANNILNEHFVEGKETFAMIQRVRYALRDNFNIDEDGVPLTMSEPPILTDNLEMFDFASDEVSESGEVLNPEEYTKVVGIKKNFVLGGWNFDYPCHFDGLNYTRDSDWEKHPEGYPPSIYLDRNVATGEFYYFEIREPTFVFTTEDGTEKPLNSITWTVRVGLDDMSTRSDNSGEEE